MLKTTKPGVLLLCCILLISCSTGRIKFGPKYETAKTDASKAEIIPEIISIEGAEKAPVVSNSDFATAIVDPTTPFVLVSNVPVTILDSTEQQTTEEQTTPIRKRKKKKEPSVFKRGMQMSGISSAAFAIAVATFFLHGISVYFPVVGIILCIVGIYFFVRGLGAYLDAKETLQWYPKEYAKAQKYGWATTVLIINCVMLATALVGILSIIF